MGKSAIFYQQLASGIDNRPIKTVRIRKSFGNETTFSQDINNNKVLADKLSELIIEIVRKLHKQKIQAKTLTVKIKYADFRQQTRSYTDKDFISSLDIAQIIATSLLAQFDFEQAVRLLGVSFSNIRDSQDNQLIQLRLFD